MSEPQGQSIHLTRDTDNYSGQANRLPHQLAAAGEFVKIIIDTLATGRGVHAETAVSAAARMAGMFLLRSLHLPLAALEPGSPVFSDAANDRGPALIQTLRTELAERNVRLDPSRLEDEVPSENDPQLSILEMQSLLEPKFVHVSAKNGLTPAQSAHACSIAAAQLIHKCTGVLDSNLGFSIAALGFVQGSKTVPIR